MQCTPKSRKLKRTRMTLAPSDVWTVIGLVGLGVLIPLTAWAIIDTAIELWKVLRNGEENE